MRIIYFKQQNPAVCAREIELRREIVAAMRLRLTLRRGSLHSLLAAGSGEQPNRISSRPADDCDGIPAMRRIRIVLISDYEGLRYSREQLLRRQGYNVEAMTSADFLESPRESQFNLAILCQSVEPDRATFLGEMLRRVYPGLTLLRMIPFSTRPDGDFDLSVDGLAGPAELLSVLETFVSTQSRPA